MENKKMRKMYKLSRLRLLIARELLFVEVDEKIPPMLDLAAKYDVSVGTVQKVFSEFQKENLIECDKKGVLGTYLRKMDRGRMLEESDFGDIIGLMPLPYSKRYESLAIGIKKGFQNRNLNFYFAHMSGSDLRIELLRKEAFNLVIISKLAFRQLSKKYKDIEIALELGEKSYVSRHVLLKAPGVKEIKTIGIDETSNDQKYLTQEYFNKKDYKWVRIDYNDRVELLRNNAVDGIIGNLDEINEKGIELSYRELKESEVLRLASEAVIVIRKNDGNIKRMIEKSVDINYIREIKDEITEGR